MKKVLVIFLLVLTILSIPVLADGFDFSEMSDEELLALSDAVSVEMQSRGISENPILYNGWYTTGRDISAGSYIITNIGDVAGEIGVFPDENSYAKYTETIDPLGSMYISVSDGELLIIWEGTYTIRPTKSINP